MRLPVVACAALACVALAGCADPAPVTADAAGIPGPDTDPRNLPPSTMLQATPAAGRAPLAVVFSLSARDAEGDNLTWSLDPGDGGRVQLGSQLPASVAHVYGPGTFRAIFTVFDGKEGATATVSMRVADPPARTSSAPQPSQAPGGGGWVPPPPAPMPPGPQPSGTATTGPEPSGSASASNTPGPSASASGSSSASGSNSVSGSSSPSASPTKSQSASASHSASQTPSPSASPTSSQSSTPSPSPSASPSPSPSPSPTPEPTPTSSGSSSATATPSPSPSPSPSPTPEPAPTSSGSSSDTGSPTPAPGNQPPSGVLHAQPDSETAPANVTYRLEGADPDGDPLEWTLDIGDDGTVEAYGTGAQLPAEVTHPFSDPGTYVAVLRVTDGSDTVTATATVTLT